MVGLVARGEPGDEVERSGEDVQRDDPDHVGDRAVAVAEGAELVDLIVGDGCRLAVDLQSEADDRGEGSVG